MTELTHKKATANGINVHYQFHILSHDLGGGRPSHWRTWRASAPCRSQPSKRRSLGSTFLDTSSPPTDGHGVAAPGKSSLGVR